MRKFNYKKILVIKLIYCKIISNKTIISLNIKNYITDYCFVFYWVREIKRGRLPLIDEMTWIHRLRRPVIIMSHVASITYIQWMHYWVKQSAPTLCPHDSWASLISIFKMKYYMYIYILKDKKCAAANWNIDIEKKEKLYFFEKFKI